MEFRKNYLAKFVKYTKNVFDIEYEFGKMQSGRVSPKYKTSTVLLTVLLGLMQFCHPFCHDTLPPRFRCYLNDLVLVQKFLNKQQITYQLRLVPTQLNY